MVFTLLKYVWPAVYYAHPFALMQCMLKSMQRLVTGSVTQSHLATK